MAEVSKTALEKARAALTKLLDGLQLSSVVLVDDECLDVSLALAKRLPALGKDAYRATLEDSEAEIDAKAYAEWKPRRFEELARKDPQLLARERRELIAQEPDQVGGPIEVLAYMCQSRFQPMTPAEWQQLDTAERNVIADASLVLFDRELGEGVDSGDALLNEFLVDFPGAYPAILTNVVDFGKEIDEALEAAAQAPPGGQGDPARSLVASKQRLTGVAPVDFVEDLRITVAAPGLVKARDSLIAIAREAHELAVADVESTIDLRTLEHIVVRAARTEGSWEADALLRVLAIIYRDRAQRLLLTPERLGAMGEIFQSLRSVFAQRGEPDRTAREKAAELMQRERYDPGSLINAAGLPLACGDLFEIRQGPEGTDPTLWILLEQPCDLQLRDDTNSRKRIASTDLIAVGRGKQPKDRGHPLPSGSRHCQSGEQLHLVLNSRMAVPFDLLELCVFDPNGRCRTDAAAEQPPNVPQTPALLRRWHELRQAHEITLRLARLSENPEVKQRVIGRHGTINPELEDVVEWPITRMERLNEPHAQLALRIATEDRSRFAVDPDLTGG